MRAPLIPAVLALAWGLNWPAVKIVLTVLPPFSLRWIGLGGGALLLLALARLQGRSIAVPRAAWRTVVVGGLFTVAGFTIFTAFAQLSTSTSRAAVLTYSFPLMAALLAWGVLGERPGRRGAAALALGAAGIGVLAWPVWLGLSRGTPWLGLIFPLLAAFSWAIGTVASKRSPPMPDRLVGTAWQLAIGALVAALAAALAGETLPDTWTAPARVALAFHIVVATALAYVWWYRLLESVSATVATLTTLAVPVVGVLGAMVLVGERPGPLDLAGFALVLGGALQVSLRRRGAA